MNKDNAAQFLPLVQALADGKTIQYNAGKASSPSWCEIVDFKPIAEPSSYRIKPEPREWECVMSSGGYIVGLGGLPLADRPIIRVREILD